MRGRHCRDCGKPLAVASTEAGSRAWCQPCAQGRFRPRSERQWRPGDTARHYEPPKPPQEPQEES